MSTLKLLSFLIALPLVAATPCTVPGANGQVMFNSSGQCAGDTGLTFNKTTDVLKATGGVETYYGMFEGGIHGSDTNKSLAIFPGLTGQQGYLYLSGQHTPQCPTGYCQTSFEIDALVDPTTKYANSDLRFTMQNPSNPAKAISTFSIGSEGTFGNSGTPMGRIYLWDYLDNMTIWFLQTGSQTPTFVFQPGVNVLVSSGLEVRGSLSSAYVFGGYNPNSVLNLRSTYNSATTTDGIVFTVGSVGSEIQAMQIGHDGVVTAPVAIQAGAYLAKDKSPGVTVNTCTAFKNGLCVAGF